MKKLLQTACWIASSTLTKAVLLAILLTVGYAAGVGRDGEVHYGPMSEWIGAIATFAAAVVALRIATNDRQERTRERILEREAQARLVRLKVEDPNGKQAHFDLTVYNYGESAILDAQIERVEWTEHSGAVGLPSVPGNEGGSVGNRLPVVVPYSQTNVAQQLSVWFVDATGDLIMKRISTDGLGNEKYVSGDPTRVYAAISFTDATGRRWEQTTDGVVKRL
ncbi:hypothetical protein [Mycobacterium dioxanotrophicus]|uniref:hypothetical protein n=1 Tax=Mycobacterium dioxanotrophicus TaxID=482462 RepID=UPI0012FC92AF|nr:hypothetical protein [Mycobacterium dioxanotrophicus]